MVPAPMSTTVAQLDSELREINTQTKSIRVQHCIKRFIIWRTAGYSPHEVMQRYRLNSHDMYDTILSAVQAETGIDRDELLKFPGCGRGQRDSITRELRLKEELSEVQRIITVYQNLSEQADILLKIIDDTIS